MARVLVVEDDPDIRKLLEVKIRRLDHDVVGAGSGEEALELLRGRPVPDVAVLDVLMPGMSGLELLVLLRQDLLYAAMPVIFLSGRVEADDIAAGTALGARYLTKPVVISLLAHAITAAVRTAPSPVAIW